MIYIKRRLRAYLNLRFAPHTSEELWHQLGHSTTIHKDSWPKFDETYLKTDTVKIIIQVNGKLRGEIEVEAEADKDEIIELAKNSPRAQDYLKDQEIKKSIYVPGKLVNFVI
jgi:leucyl-tRNA synthetase